MKKPQHFCQGSTYNVYMQTSQPAMVGVPALRRSDQLGGISGESRLLNLTTRSSLYAPEHT